MLLYVLSKCEYYIYICICCCALVNTYISVGLPFTVTYSQQIATILFGCICHEYCERFASSGFLKMSLLNCKGNTGVFVKTLLFDLRIHRTFCGIRRNLLTRRVTRDVGSERSPVAVVLLVMLVRCGNVHAVTPACRIASPPLLM